MMKRWKRATAALLYALMLLLAPMLSANAAEEGALHIIGSSQADGRLQIIMNLISPETPDSSDVSVSFAGIGIDTFQFYSSEKLEQGASLCIVPDVASANDGRAMRDLKTIVKALLEDMSEHDNACILTEDGGTLTSEREALLRQLSELDVSSANRYDALNAALDLFENDPSARMRAKIVVLSDGVGAGTVPEGLKERISKLRIPIFSVAMLYGTSDAGRNAAALELKTLAEGSHGGAAFDAGIRQSTLNAAAERIKTAIGDGYVMELNAAAVKKYVDPQGGEIKVIITTESGELSDTLTLTPEDIPLGVNDPIGAFISASPAPSEETPAQTAEPQETPVPAETDVPQDTAAPAETADPDDTAEPAVTPALPDIAAGLAPADTASPDAMSGEIQNGGLLGWYAALPLVWMIVIPAALALAIAGAVLLIVLYRRRHRRADITETAPAAVNHNGVLLSQPEGQQPPKNGNGREIAPVHLKIVRQSGDADAAQFELTVRGSLTIGSDPAKSQLIIDDDAALAPSDCMLKMQNNRLMIYDLTKANDAGEAVINGETVRIGGFVYSISWNK